MRTVKIKKGKLIKHHFIMPKGEDGKLSLEPRTPENTSEKYQVKVRRAFMKQGDGQID